MKFRSKVAVVVAGLALSAAPAVAAGPPSSGPGAGHVPENPGAANIPESPGPGASLPAKAKAYGSYCKSASKEHVEGEKGTPFSACVTAMAKLANGNARNPRTACKEFSKEHVEGEKGTPFSQCVSAGAKLLNEVEESA